MKIKKRELIYLIESLLNENENIKSSIFHKGRNYRIDYTSGRPTPGYDGLERVVEAVYKILNIPMPGQESKFKPKLDDKSKKTQERGLTSPLRVVDLYVRGKNNFVAFTIRIEVNITDVSRYSQHNVGLPDSDNKIKSAVKNQIGDVIIDSVDYVSEKDYDSGFGGKGGDDNPVIAAYEIRGRSQEDITSDAKLKEFLDNFVDEDPFKD